MARKDEEEVFDLTTDFRHYGYVESYRSMPVLSSSSMPSSSSSSLLRTATSLPSTSLDSEQALFSLYGGSSIYNGNNNNSNKSCKTAAMNPNSGSGYDFVCYDGRDSNMNKKKREEQDMELAMEMMKIEIEMEMGMEMEMQTSTDQKTKLEPEKSKHNLDIPLWSDGVDRFTNWITKSNITPLSVMSIVKEILEQLNTDQDLLLLNNNDNNNNTNDSSNSSSKDNADTNALTHIRYENIFRCRLVLDEYRICSFNIGVYKYEKENCLLDVQELSGEHLTFANFLHIFKSQLQKRQIIEEPTLTPEFIDNYGLSMEIDLDSF